MPILHSDKSFPKKYCRIIFQFSMSLAYSQTFLQGNNKLKNIKLCKKKKQTNMLLDDFRNTIKHTNRNTVAYSPIITLDLRT